MKKYEIVVYEITKKFKPKKKVVSIIVDEFGVGISLKSTIAKMGKKTLSRMGAGAEVLVSEFYGRLDVIESDLIGGR